jgi:1-acyl-sn-glycerol-3-phosphate acyltransferase
MVANHSSHLDVLMMTLAVPVSMRANLFALAAEDHFFTRVSSSFFAGFVINALPMTRESGGKGRESIAAFRARLESERCGIIIFPEGTRTRDGKMKTFKSGIGNLVAGTEIPVVPCWIEGAFEAFPAGRFLPRRCPVKIKIGKSLVFQGTPPDKAGVSAVAEKIQNAVEGLLEGHV